LKSERPTTEQHEFIELMGRWWESTTGGRAAGRILGWLMICQPPHQSSNDLVDALELSAGSVSTQIRVLERILFVERITFPGDRATYFQLRPDVWIGVMMSEPEHIRRMMELSEAASHLIPEERPDRVTDMGFIARFLLDRWPALMDELQIELEKEREK
jgi:DNA-binding transcriptional regulator GbsR (MarR family)